jgi:hypothetical protein
MTENGITTNGVPIFTYSNGYFNNSTDSAHHWSELINNALQGTGIMLTTSANQQLYAFDKMAKTFTGALYANSTTPVIEVDPVTSAGTVSFTSALDLTWYGSVVTFNGANPIYANSGNSGLWSLGEQPPSVTITPQSSAATSINLSPSSGPAGTSVTVSGGGFTPNSQITIKFNGTAIKTTTAIIANAYGEIPLGTTFVIQSSYQVGSYIITATDTSSNSASASFMLTPLDYFTVTALGGGNIGTQTAGTAFNITITAEDSSGNTVTSYTQPSTLSVSAGTISPTSTGAFTNGVWTGQVTLTQSGTSVSISTTEGSMTGQSKIFAVNAGAAVRFVVSGFLSPATAGVAQTVTVTAYDAYGNIATGYTGKVAITSSDSQAVLSANAGLTNGVGTFTVTLEAAGSQSITATDTVTSTLDGSQNGITVTHASAVSIVVSPATASITAGTPETYKAMATDAYGNTWADTASVTWSVSSGAKGNWASNVYTSATAGTWTITATDPDSVYGTASLTVNPGSATQFVVSGFPSPIDAGVAHTVTVTAQDMYGNVATGYAGTVKITSSDSKAVLPANVGLTNGVGSFTVTLKTAGTQSITATDTVTSSITGSQTGITVNPALVAPTVSASLGTVDQGQTSALSSTAVSTGTSPYSYQWLEEAPGATSYSSISGATSSSYSFATSGSTTTGSYNFELKVTDSVGAVVTSSAVSVKVDSALVVPTVSASLGTVDQGQTSALSSTTVTTGTSPYSYQWLEEAPGATSYLSISGATSSSYSFVTTGSTTTGTYSFELKVTDSASTSVAVTSTAVSVAVNVAPTVSVSPTSWTMDIGQSKTFSATASGGSGSYSSYQWYVGGSAQSGKTASTFSYSPASSGSYSVTVTVTDSLGATSAQSSAASVTVAASPTVSIAPVGPLTLDVGQSTTFTATSTGGLGTINYQWYLGGSAVSGATGSTYSFSGSVGSYSVTCKVTDSASTPVTSPASNAVSITVSASPTVSIVPVGPLTLDVGQVQTFTATASGGSGTINYQWYLDGSAVGSNSASYSYTASGSSHSVTCKVTDSASTPVTSPVSNAVSVKVDSALVAPTVSASAGTVDQTQTSSLASTAASGGTSPYSYQWLEEAPGATTYSLISGAISSSYSFATTTSTTTGTWSFELQVTDGASTPNIVASSAVSVKVNSALVAPTVSVSAGTVDQGQTSTLSSTTVTSGTSPYSYQWLEEAPGAGSYSSISGATSSSYNFVTSGSTATGTYSFELKVTDSKGVVVTSSAVSVKVDSALVAPTVSASLGTVDQGQTSALSSTTVTTGTSPYTYQWLEEAPGATTYSLISGAISSSYSFATTGSTTTGTYHFELQVTDGASTPTAVTSNAITVKVNSALVAPTISASPSTVNRGSSSSLTSTAASGGTSPYLYQWLEEAPGAGSYSSISGATSSSYNFVTTGSTATGTYHFELKVTDAAGAVVTSNAVTVRVNT